MNYVHAVLFVVLSLFVAVCFAQIGNEIGEGRSGDAGGVPNGGQSMSKRNDIVTELVGQGFYQRVSEEIADRIIRGETHITVTRSSNGNDNGADAETSSTAGIPLEGGEVPGNAGDGNPCDNPNPPPKCNNDPIVAGIIDNFLDNSNTGSIVATESTSPKYGYHDDLDADDTLATERDVQVTAVCDGSGCNEVSFVGSQTGPAFNQDSDTLGKWVLIYDGVDSDAGNYSTDGLVWKPYDPGCDTTGKQQIAADLEHEIVAYANLNASLVPDNYYLTCRLKQYDSGWTTYTRLELTEGITSTYEPVPGTVYTIFQFLDPQSVTFNLADFGLTIGASTEFNAVEFELDYTSLPLLGTQDLGYMYLTSGCCGIDGDCDTGDLCFNHQCIVNTTCSGDCCGGDPDCTGSEECIHHHCYE